MYHGYETEELVQEHIAALIRERAQHEQVGNKEGVKACDEQLRAFGHKAKAPAKRAEKRPARKAAGKKVEKRA
jgi:topoisomerase IA-like protein